jgi:hypothetical protein
MDVFVLFGFVWLSKKIHFLRRKANKPNSPKPTSKENWEPVPAGIRWRAIICLFPFFALLQ